MPTARYGARKITTAALPGVRKTAAETPAALGAGVADARARTLEQIGGVAGRFGEHALSVRQTLITQERDRADQLALLDAENTISSWENARLYDPEKGALSKRGKDAFTLPEQLSQEYEQLTGEIEKGLGTDRQREAFLKLRLDRGQSLDLTVRRHVLSEMQRYQGQELQAAVTNATNAAVHNALDPRRVGVELARAVDAIKTHGPQLGLGPEQVQQQVDATTSTVHVGVIDQLLANDRTKAATIYFEEAKDQIAGDQLARVQKAIDEGTLRGQAQQSADEILAAGGTLTEQREKARAIDDPKLRDAVMERLEHEANVRDREDRETDEATLKGAFDIVDQAKDVTKIPPATWATLSGSARASLRSYADALNRNTPIITDIPTYYGLLRQAGDDPEAFVRRNLLEVRGKLDEPEFKQLAGLQLSMRNGDTKKAEKELDGFRTNSQIIDQSLALYGIDPNAKPSTEDGRAIAQLYRMVDQRVEALANTTGKKPTNDDIQRITDQLLSTSVTVPGSWWNIFPGGKSVSDTTVPLIRFQVGDIPAADRKQIEEALRKAGRPVSDATVLNLYIETKQRGGGK